MALFLVVQKKLIHHSANRFNLEKFYLVYSVYFLRKKYIKETRKIKTTTLTLKDKIYVRLCC